MSKFQKFSIFLFFFSCLALLISVKGYQSSMQIRQEIQKEHPELWTQLHSEPYADHEKLYYDGPRVNLSRQADYEAWVEAGRPEKVYGEIRETPIFEIDPETGLVPCTEFVVGNVTAWSVKLSCSGKDYMLQFYDDEFIGYLEPPEGLPESATDLEKFLNAKLSYDYETKKKLLEEYRKQVNALLQTKSI